MAVKKNPFRHIRLVYQRSSVAMKVLVITALVVCTVTLLALTIGINMSKANTRELAQQGAALEQENHQLTEDIEELGTIKSIKDLARRFLGLWDPDTTIFSPEE